jgi:hypothetical protein
LEVWRFAGSAGTAVCRYKEGSVSESADVLVDKPAIQRYGADGGLLP